MPRRRKSNSVYQVLIVIFLLVLVFLLGRGIWGVYKQNTVARGEKSEALEQLKELEERKKELEQELIKLKTERGLEEEIRTKFQVSKPGEETVILVDPKKEESEDNKGGGLWGWIKGIFK